MRAVAAMLRISEAASLAMHAMVLLAKNAHRVVSTREIAGTLKVSEAHLSKVLQRLTRTGLLKSVRGPRGGFLLDGLAGDITLLQVYEAIEGPLTTRTCLFDRPICNGNGCILGDLLRTVNKEVSSYLSETKLSELMGVTTFNREATGRTLEGNVRPPAAKT